MKHAGGSPKIFLVETKDGVKFPDVHSDGVKFPDVHSEGKCDCKEECHHWIPCRASFCGEGGPLHTECLDECKTEQGLQDRQMTDGQCLGQDNKKPGQDYGYNDNK